MSEPVSVVICTYTDARWRLFEAAVASVEAQSAPAHEIIIVIDHNPELHARAQQTWPDHVVIENAHGRGLSGARNSGVERASGTVIAFLDDDAAAEPDWLARLCAPFGDPMVAAVGGGVVPDWSAGAPGWFPNEFLWVVGCSYTGLPAAEGTPIRNPIGANMAFRKDVLDAAGAFREEIGRVGALPVGCEETEVSIRARRLGYEIVYVPSARVHHVVPADRGTWSYFRRRCLSEGRSKAVVARFVGSDEALASERSYATRTLPLGVLRALGDGVRGPQRGAALGRAGAIVAGLTVTTAGYLEGKLRRRSTATI